MGRYYSEEQIDRARHTCLYDFLMENYSNKFYVAGNSLRMKDNPSLGIKIGNNCSWYRDFANEDRGNSVSFLINHLDYTFPEAVYALIGEEPEEGDDDDDWYDDDYDDDLPFSSDEAGSENNTDIRDNPSSFTPETETAKRKIPVFPEKTKGPYKNLFAYLKNRGISEETIKMLIDEDLIYQSPFGNHQNIVFANRSRTWGEIHGTISYAAKSFHQIVKNSIPCGYWCMRKRASGQSVIYICEAAIDAISLYELHRLNNIEENAAYVSIGGVGKQATIERLKQKCRVIIAVDNDEAGEKCRIRNSELESIIPHHKDWNEDLMNYRSSLNPGPGNTQSR